MTLGALVRRSLRHHARTNAAVVAGVACAVAVLSGALLVGESVRGSLRALVDQRLGRADVIVTSQTFFREALAFEIQKNAPQGVETVAPAIAANAIVTHESSGRRASKVVIYGIDDRFFALHGVNRAAPNGRDILLSPGLARELGVADGDAVVVRVERPSDIPLESLHGRREESGRTLRTSTIGVLPASELGEFAPSPSQGPVRAVFMNLKRLQSDLGIEGRVNLALIRRKAGAADSLKDALAAAASPADVGIRSSALGDVALVESDAGLLTAETAKQVTAIAAEAGARAMPVMTYLANEMRVGDRATPYSLITALNPGDVPDAALREGLRASGGNSIVLNDWAARDLGAKTGDRLRLEFYRWLDEGRLGTASEEFVVSAIIPIAGLAADRRLAPDYPGISDSTDLSDWDPPFPIDLARVRQIDEDYWDAYRTTAKAFIPLETGQRLWGSRYGALTSIRLAPATGAGPGDVIEKIQTGLMARLDLQASGLQLVDVRRQGQDAAEGATDFGQYFLGFSFFLLISALLLAALFFRLGVEQRMREIGLLQAIGFPSKTIRRLFLLEGLTLAVVGSLVGAALGVGYAAFVLYGLRTWWTGAVNTTALTLHVSPVPLAIGVVAGVVTAAVCIVLSLRGLRGLSTRAVLGGAGTSAGVARNASRRTAIIGAVAAVGAIALVAAGFARMLPDPAAFFPAGMLLLIAVLSVFRLMLNADRGPRVAGSGGRALSRLGVRNAAWRPGRSVLSAALVASAVFMIVSVDAFRKGGDDALEHDGSAGGFALIGESALPMVHNLNLPEGREAAGLAAAGDAIAGATFYPLRLRPGDDASCLNLYKPRRPRMVGVTSSFVEANRFQFSASLAETDEERANPWRLLMKPQPDGAVPAIADATSLQYVLHAAVGDELVIDEDSERPIRLRIVGAISRSVLRGEILIGEPAFLRLFPDQQGFRMLLAELPVAGDAEALRPRIAAVTSALEEGLADAGLDVESTNDRLAAYSRVENTYLSTFQTLGALGLLLGTVGLATVLARNVLERRRELALLRAVGYAHTHVSRVVLSEHLMLLVAGMAAGVVAAAVAILPALIERGVPGGWTLPAWLLAIFITGAVATIAAGRFALRRPLVGELRSE